MKANSGNSGSGQSSTLTQLRRYRAFLIFIKMGKGSSSSRIEFVFEVDAVSKVSRFDSVIPLVAAFNRHFALLEPSLQFRNLIVEFEKSFVAFSGKLSRIHGFSNCASFVAPVFAVVKLALARKLRYIGKF